MRIVFTSKGKDWDAQIDPRFGRTDYLFLYDEETEEVEVEDNLDIKNTAHGAGPQTAKKMFDMKPDVLITGNGPGGNAAGILGRTDMKIFTGAENMTLKEAFNAWKQDELKAY